MRTVLKIKMAKGIVALCWHSGHRKSPFCRGIPNACWTVNFRTHGEGGSVISTWSQWQPEARREAGRPANVPGPDENEGGHTLCLPTPTWTQPRQLRAHPWPVKRSACSFSCWSTRRSYHNFLPDQYIWQRRIFVKGRRLRIFPTTWYHYLGLWCQLKASVLEFRCHLSGFYGKYNSDY